MKVRWRALLAGVLWLGSGSPSLAQCKTQQMDQSFAYQTEGGGGPACVNDSEQSARFCIDVGKIATVNYDVVDETNMVGTTKVRQLDDRCVEARTTGHAEEASRTPNGWLCQPAARTVLIHIAYCV